MNWNLFSLRHPDRHSFALFCVFTLKLSVLTRPSGWIAAFSIRWFLLTPLFLLSSISVSGLIQCRVTPELVAENKSVAFEMLELGPSEPLAFKCDMLLSEAQNIGLKWGWGGLPKLPFPPWILDLASAPVRSALVTLLRAKHNNALSLNLIGAYVS